MTAMIRRSSSDSQYCTPRRTDRVAVSCGGTKVHTSLPVAAFNAKMCRAGETPYSNPSTTMGLHWVSAATPLR